MKIIEGIDNAGLKPAPRAVAMGAYDGVHRGHQRLLGTACRMARERGLQSAAITFEPIPLEVFGPQGSHNVRLTLRDEKTDLLAGLCLDTVVVADFSEQFRGITARAFARDVLAARLGTKLLVASETHAFGRGGELDVTQMRELGLEFGFDLHVAPLLADEEGNTISSSQIRSLLWAGEVARAAELLGRLYCVAGALEKGRGVGGQIGFPTANLSVPEAKLLPAEGVYVALARWEGQRDRPVNRGGVAGAAAAVSIGHAPTFGELPLLVEAHLLDLREPIEAAALELHFVARLRAQQHFSSPQALTEQIAADVRATRETLHIDN